MYLVIDLLQVHLFIIITNRFKKIVAMTVEMPITTNAVGLLFDTNSAILQLYHGENKLIINEMMMRSILY